MIFEITNHLWQSTLFVLAAALVAAALRKNGAHVRHRAERPSPDLPFAAEPLRARGAGIQ